MDPIVLEGNIATLKQKLAALPADSAAQSPELRKELREKRARYAVHLKEAEAALAALAPKEKPAKG